MLQHDIVWSYLFIMFLKSLQTQSFLRVCKMLSQRLYLLEMHNLITNVTWLLLLFNYTYFYLWYCSYCFYYIISIYIYIYIYILILRPPTFKTGSTPLSAEKEQDLSRSCSQYYSGRVVAWRRTTRHYGVVA